MAGLVCDKILHEHDFKVTPIRCAVLCAMKKSKHPATVAQLLGEFEAQAPNFVTLYRTMHAFTEAGLVRKIQLHSNETAYELSDRGDHHHIVCIKCDSIEEFDDCAVEKTMNAVLKKSKKFRVITNHTFELQGVCSACSIK